MPQNQNQNKIKKETRSLPQTSVALRLPSPSEARYPLRPGAATSEPPSQSISPRPRTSLLSKPQTRSSPSRVAPPFRPPDVIAPLPLALIVTPGPSPSPSLSLFLPLLNRDHLRPMEHHRERPLGQSDIQAKPVSFYLFKFCFLIYEV